MVLQDIGGPSSDDFTDNPYPSDKDRYSAASASPPQFDASQLPQPIPIFGPLLGYSGRATQYKTELTLKYGQRQIGRRLTPEEAQALAGHLYKVEQIKSYTAAAGVSYGAWRAYSTMSTYKYPLYTPKIETVNPDKFWIFRGEVARFARHSWRTSLWVAFGMQVGISLGILVAQPAAANASANDPKLAQFSADLKAAMEKRGFRPVPPEAKHSPREGARQHYPGGGEQQEWPPHAGAPRWPRRNPPAAPPQAQPFEDDMSPTAGSEPWLADSSDFAPDNAGTQQRQNPAYTAQQGRLPRRRQEWPAENDDASPTGGLFQDETRTQSNSNESAWDRLRRGAGHPTGERAPPSMGREAPRRQRTDEQSLGDSWTFSDSDEERRAAQIKAQREFDERLERERQGKDFDDRRW
jgi:hypothetical protein